MQEVFFIDRWIQEGRQQGLQQGEADIILRQLRRKFGNFEVAFESEIQSFPIEKLAKLGEDLIDFQTIEDLSKWLKE
jgi:hypothetical protein